MNVNSPDERNEKEGEPENGSPSSRPDQSADSNATPPAQPEGPADGEERQPTPAPSDAEESGRRSSNLPAKQPSDEDDEEEADEEEEDTSRDDDDGTPDIAENKNLQRLVESLPPEKRAELFAVIRQETSSHSGWLPTPDFMRQYDDVLPGLAERIVQLPEREQVHRHMMTQSIIHRDYRLRTTGQWMGMGALFLILLFCAFLAVLGNATAAAWVAAAVIIGTVGIFVTGQVSGTSTSSKDVLEKAD